MTGFRDLSRMKSLWKKSTQYFSRTNKKDLNGKTEQLATDVQVSTPVWKRKSILLISGAVLLLTTAGIIAQQQYQQYIEENTIPFYHVYLDGEEVGSVENPEEVERLVAERTLALQEAHPEVQMKLDVGELTYSRDEAFKFEPTTEDTLAHVESTFRSHAVGVEVVIDGKVIGVVKDQDTADQILTRVQSKFAPELVAEQASKSLKAVSTLSFQSAANVDTEDASEAEPVLPGSTMTDVGFVEDVDISHVDTEPTAIEDAEVVYEKIMTGSTKPTKYIVKAGDCVGCIAQEFDISPQVIYENNKWIKDDRITVGDELDLTVLMPELTVRTTETLIQIESIAAPVEIRQNATMRVGQSNVLEAGVEGEQRLTYTVEKQNGYVVSEELINQEILREPVTEIVEKGTMVVLGEGTGKFKYPVSSFKITSTFGQRWGRAHNGIDLVGNSSIYAADSGTVTYSGYNGALGYCIIIDHKNGFETVYGHMSSLKVKKGDKVEQGDAIGVMGNTGNSTGKHLHFEIHKNGVALNPLKYL